MRRLISHILLSIIAFSVNAQHQADVWVFANGNKLDFSSAPPEVLSGSSILPTDGEVEGVACISDEEGNLLFYSDGVSLWDGTNALVTDQLLGHQSSTNSAYIVPVPGSTSSYYLFTLDAMQNNLANGLQYSVIEVCSTERSVSLLETNELLSTNMTEKMTAIRHSNGIDYWLVTHEFNSDVFKVYLINAQGISLASTYACGSVHGPANSAAVGQMKASPDGTKIVSNITNNKTTDVLSFDPASGVMSCLLSFPPDTSNSGSFRSIYGLSFSSNSRFVYISGGSRFRLWQFDLDALEVGQQQFFGSKITLSDDDFQSGTSFHQLQLGPDGKVYCASWDNEYLAVINEPNLPGLACAFEDSAIQLNNLGNYGLPAFIDSYDYTISGTCDTSVGIEETVDKPSLSIYPNPTTADVQLTVSQQVVNPILQVVDNLGRLVKTIALPSNQSTYNFSTAALPSGVYFCTLLNGIEVVATQKLVVH